MDQAPASMKSLFGLLEHFEESSPDEVQTLDDLIRSLGTPVIQELGHRLLRPSTPQGLKRLIYSAPHRFPWPEWTPALLRGLLHEHAAGLFEEGCRALVRLGGPAETDALRQIAYQRTEQDLGEIVGRKLAFLEERQPFEYHFKDLLLGSSSPRSALLAAEYLAASAGIDRLPSLDAAVENADELVAGLALRVIAAIRDPAAGRALVRRFEDLYSAIEEDRQLKETLDQCRNLAPGPMQSALLPRLEARFGDREAPALARMRKAAEEGLDAAPADAERLQAAARGEYERMLAALQEALAAGRLARLHALPGEAMGALRKRNPRLRALLEEAAQGLGTQAGREILDAGEILDLLEPAFVAGLGGDGLSWSFASLLPTQDARRLDLVLSAIDPQRRETCLRVLGEKEDPELLTFFLKAMGDPITDLAQQAGRYLGRLPGALDLGLELLAAGRPDSVRTALRIFSLNGMSSAGEPIQAFLEQCEREDLSLEAIRALGGLRHQAAIPFLLSLLRGGQSPRLHMALGEALEAIGSPEACLGLLQRAFELKHPPLGLLALRALAGQYPSMEDPIPEAAVPEVEALLFSALDEGGRPRMSAIEALQGLWARDGGFYERAKVRILEYQADQRRRPTWDHEELQRVLGVQKELDRRLDTLALLAQKAQALREVVKAAGAGDPKAWEALRSVPRGVLDPSLRQELGALLSLRLTLAGLPDSELAGLCALAGQHAGEELAEPLLDLYHRSGPASELRRAAHEALLRLGVREARLKLPRPAREILVLDPNGFFRTRILAALQDGGWRVRGASSHGEAEALLGEAPADLLISESADEAGELAPWLQLQWEQRRLRKVLLSTADRRAAELRRAAWCAGILLKPYPMERLLGHLAAEAKA